MNVLLDTNILARIAHTGHHQHQIASNAVDGLKRRGDIPCLVPQVLYELWAVATRPTTANGLGFTPAQAAAELGKVQFLFPLLPDSPAIFPQWQHLVVSLRVIGRNTHDARLVAAMTVHGLTQILTFNTADFARYSQITVIDPVTVAA